MFAGKGEEAGVRQEVHIKNCYMLGYYSTDRFPFWRYKNGILCYQSNGNKNCV